MATPEVNDGGFKSRKLIFALYTSLLISVLGLAAAKWAGVAGVYPAIVGGLLGCLGLYLGGNVSSRYIHAKTANIPGDPEAPEKDDSDPKTEDKPETDPNEVEGC